MHLYTDSRYSSGRRHGTESLKRDKDDCKLLLDSIFNVDFAASAAVKYSIVAIGRGAAELFCVVQLLRGGVKCV